LILFNKKIFFTSLVLVLVENAFVLIDDEKSFQRFFSFFLSLLMVNVLFWMKDKLYFIPFLYFTYILFFLRFWPVNTIVNNPDETTVAIVFSFICILLILLNQEKLLYRTSIIISVLVLFGFYFDNRTLLASIILFTLIKALELFFLRSYLRSSSFYSAIFPVGLIFIVIYLGQQLQNPTILGFRDYFWTSAIFGAEIANKNYTMPIDPFKIVYLNHLIENNVHNNFVGLFSRLNTIVAICSWTLFYYIIKVSYKNYLHNWKVQFSLFVLICQSLFTGKSLFSIDDFSIIFWIGIFGIISIKNANKKVEFIY